MIDHHLIRRLLFILLFIAISTAITFWRLLPLETRFSTIPAPEIMLLVAFAWGLRRPDYVPVLVLGIGALINDLVFLSPPGLWAALSVLALEAVRSRSTLLSSQPFGFEWALVAVVIFAMVVIERLVLAVFFVDQAALYLSVLRWLVTVAAYPLVVVISVQGLGIHRPDPSELQAEARLA